MKTNKRQSRFSDISGIVIPVQWDSNGNVITVTIHTKDEIELAGFAMEDMFINCVQCGADFEFSVDDQIRHREMNFDDPKRCPDCRKRKSKPPGSRDKKFNHRKKSDQIMFEY